MVWNIGLGKLEIFMTKYKLSGKTASQVMDLEKLSREIASLSDEM